MVTNRFVRLAVLAIPLLLAPPDAVRASGAPDAPATEAATDPREALDAVQWARVRRLAPTWTGARMDVLPRSGSLVTGRFRGLHDEALVLADGDGGTRTVPVRELARITLRRRPGDLAMATVLAIGVGGLFAAVGTLGLETEGGGTAAMAAAGLAVGAGIGWKTVYRERVVSFD
jgi:hypothetical protein